MAAAKVLIVGEGKHELSGALEALVVRVCSDEIECEFDFVRRSDIHAVHGRGRGYFQKAMRWVFEARKRGFDALVLVIDEDGKQERRRELSEAQDSAPIYPRAMGVAVRTFDAWILSDESALSATLETTVDKQPAPEKEKDPKARCRSLLRDSPVNINQAEMYRRVCRGLAIDSVAERCSKGFAPFKHRLEAML